MSTNELAQLAKDPLQFVKLCWPEMKLYDKQKEVLRSMAANLETFVHAANQTGKTRIAAIVAIWFFLSRTPARVVVTSSSESQLLQVLWPEIRHLIDSSRISLPLSIKNLRIEKLKAPNSGKTFARDYLIGCATNTVENFQGHHLPQGQHRVLVIFDEASGISDELYDASTSWAHQKLVIGNPLSNTNFFYRKCKRGDAKDPAGRAYLLRKVIHISAADSPNVQAGKLYRESGGTGPAPIVIAGIISDEEYLRRMQDWDAVQRTTRLDGRFHEGEESRLVPDAWLDVAMDRNRWNYLAEVERTPTAIGIDVAAGGRDNTVWTLVDQYGIVEQFVMDLSNTMEIAGRTIEFMTCHDIDPYFVAIDAGGGGKQIADRLKEQGYDIHLVGFGESAEAKSSYRNRRAELYGELRNRLRPDQGRDVFAIPPDATDLRNELAIIPLSYDSEGKLLLIPKDNSRAGEPSIRKLLGRSPDRADSLALAVWALQRPVCNDWIVDDLICSGDVPYQELTEEDLKELDEIDPILAEIVRGVQADNRQRDLDEPDFNDWDRRYY